MVGDQQGTLSDENRNVNSRPNSRWIGLQEGLLYQRGKTINCTEMLSFQFTGIF